MASKNATYSTNDSIAYAQNVKIDIPVLTKKILIRKACEHYNEYYKSTHRSASPKDPDEFIFRIAVNFLRHQVQVYEQVLQELDAGGNFREEAYKILKERILDEIASVYPWIRKECALQKGTLKTSKKTA